MWNEGLGSTFASASRWLDLALSTTRSFRHCRGTNDDLAAWVLAKERFENGVRLPAYGNGLHRAWREVCFDETLGEQCLAHEGHAESSVLCLDDNYSGTR